MNEFFSDYFRLINKAIESADGLALKDAATRIKHVGASEKKIILVGNGGSAAIASHVAVDFIKTARIRAINFNEADLLTCFSNDYGYERVFEKAVEFYGDECDILILISSSGQSENILRAAAKAKEMKLSIITFSGFKRNNPLRKLGDVNFWVESETYNIVEMTHHIWLLAIVDYFNRDIQYSD